MFDGGEGDEQHDGGREGPRVNGSVQECSAGVGQSETRASRPRVTVMAPGTSSRCFVVGLLSARTAGAMGARRRRRGR